MIYATGCSWTAGAELADSEVFARWPGAVDLKSDYQRQWHRDWFLKDREQQLRTLLDQQGPDVVFKIADREKSLAWPARLAALTGKTVKNAALNGSCQELCLIQAREDLRGQENVKIIAQLTSPYRWLYPNLYTREQPWTAVLVGNYYDPKSPEHAAFTAFMAWPKESAEIKWLHDVINLIQFARLNGHDLKLIQAWDWEFRPEDYPDLWREIKPYMISDQTIDQQFGQGQRNPGGHPTQSTHDRLATWLAERI